MNIGSNKRALSFVVAIKALILELKLKVNFSLPVFLMVCPCYLWLFLSTSVLRWTFIVPEPAADASGMRPPNGYTLNKTALNRGLLGIRSVGTRQTPSAQTPEITQFRRSSAQRPDSPGVRWSSNQVMAKGSVFPFVTAIRL